MQRALFGCGLCKDKLIVVKESEEKMNREIKFRGKRQDNGKRIEGSLRLIRYGETYIAFICVDDGNNGGTEYCVDYKTVGEYTGLKDKDGKDLDWWEDDLIRVKGKPHKIIFEDGCFWFLSTKTGLKMLCKFVKMP